MLFLHPLRVIVENYQVGQALFPLCKSMLTALKHCLKIISRIILLHQRPHNQVEANWLSLILFLAFFEDKTD